MTIYSERYQPPPALAAPSGAAAARRSAAERSQQPRHGSRALREEIRARERVAVGAAAIASSSRSATRDRLSEPAAAAGSCRRCRRFRSHRDIGRTLDDPLLRLMRIDAQTQLPEDLLLLTDKVTMATSIECRVPFLDHRLVGAGRADSRVGIKMRGGDLKHLLKKSLAGTAARRNPLSQQARLRRADGRVAEVGARAAASRAAEQAGSRSARLAVVAGGRAAACSCTMPLAKTSPTCCSC